jgi:hypothetical protein
MPRNSWGVVCVHQEEGNLLLGAKGRNKMKVVEVRTGTVEMRTRTLEVEVVVRNVFGERHGH